MSLKYVHLLFITMATILTWLFGAWCFLVNSREPALSLMLGGVAGAVLGFVLVAYGVYFYRKAKRLIL